MVPFQKILCPTDFSDCALQAFHLACSLARFHGARLILAHVVDVEYGTHSYGGMLVEVRSPNYPEQQFAKLKALLPPDPEVPVEHIQVEGRPAEAILQLAKETHCDLLVMGTHGLTGLQRLLLGSVTEQVLRQAPCPVLTVRASPPAQQ